MFGQSLKQDRSWMTHRLSETAMSEFDRNNALAKVAQGVLIGTVLSKLWRSMRRA